MNKYIFTIAFAIITFQHGLGKDKDFLQQYDAFRFSLHSYLNEGDEIRMTPEMTAMIQSFLDENESDIIKFRTHQLEKYERADLVKTENYEKIDSQYLDELRKMAVMLNLEQLMNEMDPVGKLNDENIGALQLVELLSVDPIAITNNIVGQLTYIILNQRLELNTSEISQYYYGLAIGGQYISTRQEEKDSWEIKLNSHTIVYVFSFHTIDGKLSLDEVWTR